MSDQAKKEAADLVFDVADGEINRLRDELVDMADRHRDEVDRLRNRLDEALMDYREWRSIAVDLYYGCVCQVSEPEDGHQCGYQKARQAVRFWWTRENRKLF